MTARARWLFAVLVAVGLVAGCTNDTEDVVSGGDATSTSEATTTTGAGGATSVPADEQDAEPVGDFTIATKQTEGFPDAGREGGTAHYVDVRVAHHEGFDRVVFEFRDGPVPGYRIQYVEPPIREDGSGNEVAVDGDAFLEVIMTPASGVEFHDDGFTEVYEGPDRIDPAATEVVTELVETGDFEATLTWHIGLDSRRPFAAAALADPARLVIDVAAGGTTTP